MCGEVGKQWQVKAWCVGRQCEWRRQVGVRAVGGLVCRSVWSGLSGRNVQGGSVQGGSGMLSRQVGLRPVLARLVG